MESAQKNPGVEIRAVTKKFGRGAGQVKALDGVTLTIGDNEFFTLLGPSGCGKTTLLRMIAGFEQPDDGGIFLFGEDIKGLPPHRRPVNTVFQHYALFPHMTVAENVAFSLRMLGRAPGEIERTIGEMLALVKMEQFAARKPAQLSGGQQQRIALARALAPRPRVLLLDEPLSALDLKLRQAMRAELKTMRQRTGITFVFVTHDQEEALTMSDRIAVMSGGRVRQTGAPRDIYEKPRDSFVANFIGESNFLTVTVERLEQDTAWCRLDGALLQCSRAGEAAAGFDARVSIRPEQVSFSADGGGGPALSGVVENLTYLGTDTQLGVRLGDGQMLQARVQNAGRERPPPGPGQRIRLRVNPGAARLLAD